MKPLLFLSLLGLFVACGESTTENKDTDSGAAPTQTPAATENPAAETPLPDYFSKRLEGSINQNLGVVMRLNRAGTPLSGSYFYLSKKQPIELYGSIKPDGSVQLTEYANVKTKDGMESKETGKFVGNYKGNVFKGTWSGGGKNLSFELKETNAPGSATLDYKHYEKSYKAGNENGAKISYTVFQVVDCGSEAAKKAINDDLMNGILTASFEDSKKRYPNIDAVMEEYIRAYKEDIMGMKDEMPASMNYEEESFYTVETNENGVLCVSNSVYSYMGGAHPNSYTELKNYDLNTGKIIALKDLFVSGYAPKLRAIAEKLFREQNGMGPKESLSDAGYDFGADGKFQLNDNFSIQAGGLYFQYNSYEIAAYAMGAPAVFIPYSSLKELIKPEGKLAAFVR